MDIDDKLYKNYNEEKRDLHNKNYSNLTAPHIKKKSLPQQQ